MEAGPSHPIRVEIDPRTANEPRPYIDRPRPPRRTDRALGLLSTGRAGRGRAGDDGGDDDEQTLGYGARARFSLWGRLAMTCSRSPPAAPPNPRLGPAAGRRRPERRTVATGGREMGRAARGGSDGTASARFRAATTTSTRTFTIPADAHRGGGPGPGGRPRRRPEPAVHPAHRSPLTTMPGRSAFPAGASTRATSGRLGRRPARDRGRGRPAARTYAWPADWTPTSRVRDSR